MLKKSKVNLGEYSFAILPVMNEHLVGTVHSVFQTGFNIRFGSRLVFVGLKKNGIHPFGIHMKEIEDIINYIYLGENIYWDKLNQILCFNEFNLDLKKFDCVQLIIEKNDDRANLLFSYFSIYSYLLKESKASGLEIDFKKLDKDHSSTQLSKDEVVLLQLMESVRLGQKETLYENIQYFIGRGKGLTPAGDDFIIGFLAVHVYYSFFDNHSFATINDILVNTNNTTVISKEYFYYASQGLFSTVIINLLNFNDSSNQNITSVIEELLEVGHSSGYDTLLGIAVGMKCKLMQLNNSNRGGSFE